LLTRALINLAVLASASLLGASLFLSFSVTAPEELYRQSIGEGRFLLLDDRIIDEVENARLAVGTVEKYPGNPLFVEDMPWEKRFDNFYGNVIFDEEEGLYKCWYNPFIVDYSSQGMTLEQRQNTEYAAPPDREMAICYATSVDGINWEKPALGLVEYEGSKQNNIVWRGPHGAGVFKDPYDPDPARRYKIIFLRRYRTTIQGLYASFSEDGIHWEPAVPIEGIHIEGVDVKGDTHNNAFWAPTLGKYVGITRGWEGDEREVVRVESADFLNWSGGEVILKGDRDLQTYSMPVFFYGGVYLGLVSIYDLKTGRVQTELAWSPDTEQWKRIDAGTPLIPCSETKLDYDYGCVYGCANPVILEDEIRLYYGGSDWLHSSWRCGSFNLATLRPDGFAGYVQILSDRPAVITTSLIPCSGETIRINADVEEGGSMKISILDDRGNVLSEKWISETMINGELGLDEEIEADSIRLKFEFNNAKVYSFWFDGHE